ncbi:CDP-alcohol phosphatidyltransferase family protein [Aurantiacibacter atlanticus]|nr:CDP-alcohol phosphatidyltransferase family protein [Aurantiacibacter atlanticus]
MPHSDMIIRFESEQAANYPVAGIPAAVRAVLALPNRQRWRRIAISVPGGWRPSMHCLEEWHRLCSGVAMNPCDDQYPTGSAAPHIMEGIVILEDAVLPKGTRHLPAMSRLHALHAQIIKDTAKPTDGIVSRHLNRPVSQGITRVLLHVFPQIIPLYATVAVAIFALVMIAALLLGGTTGAIIGAVLFQAASVLDGVDGEIARATFRTSQAGATMDSVTDAFTNLGFIMGLSWNLCQQGETLPASAGAAGLVLLAIGLLILGTIAYRRDGRVHFDALKTRFSTSPNPIGAVLAKIFMRDFYALALALAVIAGFAGLALFLFAGAVAGWLAIVVWTVLFSRMA